MIMRSTYYSNLPERKNAWITELKKSQERILTIRDETTKNNLTKYAENLHHRVRTHDGNNLDYAEIYSLMGKLNDRIRMVLHWEKKISEFSDKIAGNPDIKRKFENLEKSVQNNIHYYVETGESQAVVDSMMELDILACNHQRKNKIITHVEVPKKKSGSGLSVLSLFCCFGCPDSCGDEEMLIDDTYFGPNREY